MDRIGVRELRQNASKYLSRVEKGESIEVTDRGRLVALLVPAPVSTYDRLVAVGRLIPAVDTTSVLDDPPLHVGPEVGERAQRRLSEAREDRL